MWFIIFQKYAHYTCSILAPSEKHTKSWNLYRIVSVSLLYIPVQTTYQISQPARKNLCGLLSHHHSPAEREVVAPYEENDSEWCHFVMALFLWHRGLWKIQGDGVSGAVGQTFFAKPEHAKCNSDQCLISVITFCLVFGFFPFPF